jgi:hypothetical protein
VLFYYGVQDDPGTNPRRVFVRDSVMIDSVADAAYHEKTFNFIVPTDTSTENWFNEIFVEWPRNANLWVDYIEDSDDKGRGLASIKDSIDEAHVQQYAQQYSFRGNPNASHILGFYLDEERSEDANVLPQYWVDSLIKTVSSSLQGFTEHGRVWKWSNTPGIEYGGRAAASARLQHESHVSPLSYPMSGLDPYHRELTPHGYEYIASASVLAEPTCKQAGSDTSICFQARMDEEGQYLRFEKHFAQSVNARMTTWAQGYAETTRKIPQSCYDDTAWYGGARPPTVNETKCHAGILLASGANGLLYYRYAGTRDSVRIKLSCQQDSAWYVYNDRRGFNQLPDVQSALKNFVGPFVDSLGHYFADAAFWVGGGRLDVSRDSTGLSDLFDSTARSLTFTSAGDSAYVEAGVFQSGSIQYFLLVNRRAYDSIPQEVLVWLDPAPTPSSPLYYVIDQFSKDTVLAGGMGASNGQLVPFRASINPGEFRFFKIVSAGTSVSGNAYPKTWIGRIPVSAGVQVDSNKTLTVLGPAEIRVANGGSYAFNVYGNLVTSGIDADTSITFRSSNLSTPGRSDWYGIKQLGPGNVTLKHTRIRDAYNGLRVTSANSVDTITVDSCDFLHGDIAGVWIEANTSSAVLVQNSRFTDFSSYGVHVYRGDATVKNNHFSGSMLYGVIVQGTAGWTTGARIISNVFESMTSTNGYAIYLRSLTNDGLGSTDTTAGGNSIAGYTSGQIGIYVSNCADSDTLRLAMNSISAGGYAYGILNYSTKTRIEGSHAVAESLSAIRYARYGIYCLSSSSSDPDFATVRNISIHGFSSEVSTGAGVWKYSSSKVDLGTTNSPGGNAIYGFCPTRCGYLGSRVVYSVYNGDTFALSARGNYWAAYTCGGSCWPFLGGANSTAIARIDTVGMLSANPFANPLGKVVASEIPEENPSAQLTPSGRDLVVENYPNPFNSATVIRFTVPEAGNVKVTVYDVLGQRVRELCNGVQPVGECSLTWDGRDEHDRPISSGVYFYRVQTLRSVVTKKMVIIK